MPAPRALVHGQGGDVVVAQEDLAAVGPGQAHHHVEGRGLARAVGPEQAHHLAGVDLEVHVLHDHAPAVGLGERPRAQERRAGRAAVAALKGWRRLLAAPDDGLRAHLLLAVDEDRVVAHVEGERTALHLLRRVLQHHLLAHQDHGLRGRGVGRPRARRPPLPLLHLHRLAGHQGLDRRAVGGQREGGLRGSGSGCRPGGSPRRPCRRSRSCASS